MPASTLFLFGAGASAFSGSCTPTCPPLGGDLFAELLKVSPAARAIPGPIQDMFKLHFEDGMQALLEGMTGLEAHLLREMAAFFATFRPRRANRYSRFIDAVGPYASKCVFASLNYDILLELSLVQRGYLPAYSPSALLAKNQIRVIKVHGSCNFLPGTNVRFENVNFVLPPDFEGQLMNSDDRYTLNPTEILEFCREQNSISPELALYHKSKRMLFVGPVARAQKPAFFQHVAEARNIVIIGVRLHEPDTHIWEPIAASPARIYYVGPDATDIRAWGTRNGKTVEHLSNGFKSSIPKIGELLKATSSP